MTIDPIAKAAKTKKIVPKVDLTVCLTFWHLDTTFLSKTADEIPIDMISIVNCAIRNSVKNFNASFKLDTNSDFSSLNAAWIN